MTSQNELVLVAGTGNIWMMDDGFGSEVARKLIALELSDGLIVIDFGISGLDLTYELQKGCGALVLVDISRQGGDAGNLYVMQVDESQVETDAQKGMMMDPHGMDPETVLRFIKSMGVWPGKVVVVACEPTAVGEFDIGLSPAVESAVDGAVDLVLSTVGNLQAELASS